MLRLVQCVWMLLKWATKWIFACGIMAILTAGILVVSLVPACPTGRARGFPTTLISTTTLRLAISIFSLPSRPRTQTACFSSRVLTVLPWGSHRCWTMPSHAQATTGQPLQRSYKKTTFHGEFIKASITLTTMPLRGFLVSRSPDLAMSSLTGAWRASQTPSVLSRRTWPAGHCRR